MQNSFCDSIREKAATSISRVYRELERQHDEQVYEPEKNQMLSLKAFLEKAIKEKQTE